MTTTQPPGDGETPSGLSADSAPSTVSRAAPRTRLRAIDSDDHEAVQALFKRHGWPVRSRAGWDWALIDNPARVATEADAGWVLEHGDQIVGFLGNLPMRYRLDGLSVWGATCTSYLVDESHRAHSTRLLRAFAAQPGAAFVFSATANAHSAPVYRAFKFQASPQPRAQQRMRWVASEAAAVDHALRRVHLGLLKPFGRIAAAGPIAWRRLRERWQGGPHNPGWHVDRLSAAALGGAGEGHWPRTWDSWAQKHAGRPGLWVDRSAATCAWRLSDPDQNEGATAAWAVRDGDGRMLGMCMARHLPRLKRSPPKIELLDLAVLPTAVAEAPALLLHEVRGWARSVGAAVIDAKRWTGEAATMLEGLHPRREPMPIDGVWLLAHTQRGTPDMGVWPNWGMTGADSDDWFCTHRLQAREEAPRWIPPGQAWRAELNSSTRSDTDSTADGSKRSISTV
jgi:hypothetical protein